MGEVHGSKCSRCQAAVLNCRALPCEIAKLVAFRDKLIIPFMYYPSSDWCLLCVKLCRRHLLETGLYFNLTESANPSKTLKSVIG